MISYKISDVMASPLLEEVRFGGRIEEKVQKVLNMRALNEEAKAAFAEAESAFDTCVDDKDAPNGIWQGEFWGKLMISACGLCRYSGNAELKEFLRGSAYRVMAHQRPDGYLGTYRNERLIFRVDPEKAALPGKNDWNWNLWCRKYTIWGLLEAYELLGDAAILKAAEASALQIIEMLEDMQVPIAETGTFFGVASASILKPMLILYRLTGRKRFLDFAVGIADQWQDSTTCCCKLINCALEGIPPMYWNMETSRIPMRSAQTVADLPCRSETRKPETAGKVYETLSCFEGLMELYRFTGTPVYLEAGRAFFRLLMKYEYNTLFSVGFNDLFLNGAFYHNSLSELCDVLHFMRFAYDLYALTGEPDYLDPFEKAFYNPFLGGVARDGSWAARMVRPIGGHHYARVQAGFTKNHCCTNNMARGLMNAAQATVMTDAEHVYVNLYHAFEALVHPAEGENVRIFLSDGFLQEGQVSLKILSDAQRSLTLMLRIPEWTPQVTVACGTAEQIVRGTGSNFYAPVELKPGETELTLHFARTAVVHSYPYDEAVFALSPYYINRYLSGSAYPEKFLKVDGKVHVTFGPLLLAMTVEDGTSAETVFDPTPHTCVSVESLSAVPEQDRPAFCACAFDAAVKLDGTIRKLRLYDFASASDEADDQYEKFSIFI